MRRRKSEKMLVEMDYYDLDKLIYKKTREANEQLFGGILPFINRLFDENERILKEMDYLKAYIQGTEKPFVTSADDTDEQPRGTTPEEMYEEPSEEELEAVKRYLEKTEHGQRRYQKKYTPKLKIKELS
ncbi:hypothetical protein [Halalkalibacter okhensis]|uniref:Uncharacterized protein n=1 Tax=Halalkalibacter okhensis TaxID=333138 RepID=A0A0B0IM25_9BACI|nr:hypothetical protein [Halalkalibacter okhensis]KHF40721.1 hypothetical protein LQ50_08005 [Halalkalibacter okhensis]